MNSDEISNVTELFKFVNELKPKLEDLEKRINDIEEIVYKDPVI